MPIQLKRHLFSILRNKMSSLLFDFGFLVLSRLFLIMKMMSNKWWCVHLFKYITGKRQVYDIEAGK